MLTRGNITLTLIRYYVWQGISTCNMLKHVLNLPSSHTVWVSIYLDDGRRKWRRQNETWILRLICDIYFTSSRPETLNTQFSCYNVSSITATKKKATEENCSSKKMRKEIFWTWARGFLLDANWLMGCTGQMCELHINFSRLCYHPFWRQGRGAKFRPKQLGAAWSLKPSIQLVVSPSVP